jgi:hypothetical protein
MLGVVQNQQGPRGAQRDHQILQACATTQRHLTGLRNGCRKQFAIAQGGKIDPMNRHGRRAGEIRLDPEHCLGEAGLAAA